MPPDAKRSGPDTTPDRSRKASDLAAEAKPTIPPGAGTGRECAWCHGELAPRRRRFCSDEHRRKGQKAERVIEDAEYASGVVRLIRKMGVRASADLEALKWLAGAAEHARGVLAVAVDGCRARGYSDGEIGAALGISRQAVGQRFGRKRDVYTGQATRDGTA
jgi:hypothetical protein